MADRPDPTSRPRSFGDLVKWAITPPQSYAVYVIGLLLVYSLSYVAGTLNPKKSVPPPQPAVSAPRD
jgi:hypothetical protein